MREKGKTEAAKTLETPVFSRGIEILTEKSEFVEVSKMSDSRLKGISVILFGILLSASSAEMNRTVLASFSNFPFALVGIIVGIVGLVMVFKSNKE